MNCILNELQLTPHRECLRLLLIHSSLSVQTLQPSLSASDKKPVRRPVMRCEVCLMGSAGVLLSKTQEVCWKSSFPHLVESVHRWLPVMDSLGCYAAKMLRLSKKFNLHGDDSSISVWALFLNGGSLLGGTAALLQITHLSVITSPVAGDLKSFLEGQSAPDDSLSWLKLGFHSNLRSLRPTTPSLSCRPL